MLPVSDEAEEEVGDEVEGVVSVGDGFELVLAGLEGKNGAPEEPEAAADVGREAEGGRGQVVSRLALARRESPQQLPEAAEDCGQLLRSCVEG